MTQKMAHQRRSNGPARKVLRFGDLVAAVYEHCGKARASGLLRLAVNAHLVEFPRQRRFIIVTQ